MEGLAAALEAGAPGAFTVGYGTKSRRGALPKMVLLGDIVGEDEGAGAAAVSEIVRLANARSGEGFDAWIALVESHAGAKAPA